MPWRLVLILVIFGIFLAFITFNLENRCDVSFGFTKIQDVPVFLTIFFSFVFGMLFTVPFIVRAGIAKKTVKKEEIERLPQVDIKQDGGFHGNT